MQASAPFRLNRSGVMLAIVSAAFVGEASAAAGRAEFTIGGVTLSREGVERPLARGTELDNGDVVRTNDGRAQIRFTDGAYVSLQPNTEFGIREYLFDNKTDGSERGFFGLVKGAMRTVTGAIGRINRNRYQITTPTATVGIRGTGGVIQVQDDGSTLVIGTSGIWSLTNPAGSVDVPAGTSALAPSDPNQPPQESTQQPTSGPAPLPDQEPEFIAGNVVDEAGNPVIPEPSLTPLLVSGSAYAASAAYEAFGQPELFSGGTVAATFNSAGQLTNMSTSIGDFALGSGGSHADFGTDGLLAWGRWIGPATVVSCIEGCFSTTVDYGATRGLHYVIGLPTAALPTTGTATYSLLGATQPTYTDGSASPGTFSGSLNVDFGRGTVGMSLGVAMPADGRGYTIDGNATIVGRTFSGSQQFGLGSLTVSGTTATSCLSDCNASVNGFFAGASAERAGLGYHIKDFIANKDVVGAAAFQSSGLSQPVLIQEQSLSRAP